MEETYKYYTVILLIAAIHFAQGFRVMYQKRPHLQLSPLMSEDQKLFFKPNQLERETIGTLGQTLILDCEAGGSPAPTIHWLHKGKRLAQGVAPKEEDDEAHYEHTRHNEDLQIENLHLGSTKSRLFIDCLSPKTVGEYTCVAETPFKKISIPTEVSIDLTSVPEELDSNCIMKRIGGGTPARIHMWTAQRLEFEGADVQLFCRADGNPATSIRWEDQRGNEITTDQKQYTVLDNGDLLIRSINWSNMGVYVCKAENENGSDAAQVFLYPTLPE